MSTTDLPVSGSQGPDSLGRALDELPPPRVPDYELLRRIGRGGYGEVWLGRSVTGAYRAVKIVRRQTFDSDRPYEREFRGIKAFEPVSLSHDSQLDVLHVGRNDAEGYFFYVLELADNVNDHNQPASMLVDWEGYAPRTLREELRRRERIPFDECVELGVRLATALDHLHRHGLVHRDVKPANIVFVNGSPKLADIGLVAPQDDTASFVGTRGYLPPEGPGTQQADVYSLGMVLYEASTGKHREEYPEFPSTLNEGAPAAAQEEFKEILIRTCARDPGERYESATALRSELLLLQGGGSVKRLRTLERRMAVVRKFGPVLVGMCLLAGGGYFYQRDQAQRMGELAERARQRLVRLHVSNSLHLQVIGDYHASLVGLIEALRIAKTPEEEEVQRRRVAAVFFETPRLAALGAHDRSINHAQISADGRWLLTVSDDHSGAIWDLETGSNRVRLIGHSGPVTHASFSQDALRVVTASDDGTACVWDAATGERLLPPLEHEAAVLYAWFDPTARRVLTASAEGTARLWDASTGRPLFDPFRHAAGVEHACFSGDGRFVVTASKDQWARVWDTDTGREAGPGLFHANDVTYAVFGPDNKIVITGSRDGIAQVWDFASGQPLGPPMRHKGKVRYLCISPEGERLLVAAGEHLISGEGRVWSIASGEPLTPRLRHALHVSHAAFSPDGRWVATASADQTVRIWNANTGLQPGPTMRHTLPAWFVEFSPDGRHLVTAGRDRLWRSWDLATESSSMEWHPRLSYQSAYTEDSWRALTNAFATGQTFRFGDEHKPLSISPCGRWVVTADDRGLAMIREITTGRPVSEPIRHEMRIGLVEFNATGTRMLTISQDRTARVWEVPTGRAVTPPLTHRYPVCAGVFSLDGSMVATGTREFLREGRGEARVWNAATGAPITETLEHSAPLYALEFSPDSSLLVTASAELTTTPQGARLWEIATGRLVAELVHEENSIGLVRFSPDGRWLVTGGTDGLARLWDVRTHQSVGPPLNHLRGLSFVTFSPNGERLATGCADGTARIWELPTGLPITPKIQCGMPVFGGVFSPDGNALLINRHDAEGGESAVVAVGPDWRPIDALENLVEMESGSRIGADGTLESLRTEEILTVSSRVREHFGMQWTRDRDRARRWHRAQAYASDKAGNAFASRFHAGRLSSLERFSPLEDQQPGRP